MDGPNVLGGYDGAYGTLTEIDLATSSKGTYDINRQLSTEAGTDLKVKLVKTQVGLTLLLDDKLVKVDT